jgi:spore coat protein JB
MNMPNTENAETAPGTLHKPTSPNTGAMPKHDTTKRPEMTADPNIGVMPETALPKSNMKIMPEITAKPNMGTMPKMTAKPNAGMMPEVSANPNVGLMPEKIPQSSMKILPDMAPKLNMADMPYMTPKPNAGMMPESTPKPNTGAMPYMTTKPLGNDMSGCGYKNGELPPCAPLSVGFVPFQQKNPPKYESQEALTRGTLFPGLDLPWNNIANKSNPYAGTPMGELMALGFVIKELNLYLDTHPKDKEALDMLKSLNKLMQEGQERFIEMFGPQTIMDITSGDEYSWINDPWPWEYSGKGGSDSNV